MKVHRDKRVSKGKYDRNHWPESKKLEVLQAYIITGNLRLSAATCNVPEETTRVWKTTQWWKDTEEELRRGSKIQLGAKLSDLIQKSMDQLHDRLENGDYIYDYKSKTFARKPISAEHANKITVQLIDRTLAVEKSANVEKITDEGLDARLKKISDELKNFIKPGYIPPSVQGKVIDVSPITAPTAPSQSAVLATEAEISVPPVQESLEVLQPYSLAARRLGLDDPNQPRVTLGEVDNS